LARRRKAIFVHGCFWHQHPGCRKAEVPKSRQDYWVPKLKCNSKRDSDAISALSALGWSTFVIWQCEMKDKAAVAEALREFLGPPSHSS
jgi:DNA mismatch endonuclease (patch repair protein)